MEKRAVKGKSLLLLFAIFLQTGCASLPGADKGRDGEVSKTWMLAPNAEYSAASGRPLYRVWYGTNRKPIDPIYEHAGYSGDRDDKIHYGNCLVEVPKSHEFGAVGWLWAWRFVTSENKKVTLEKIVPMRRSEFFDSMADELIKRPNDKRTALVYIHGYNVSFEEAAVRAAQMGFDLKVEGITAFFSWPSKGNVFGYAADEASIQASEFHLEEFLKAVISESDAERVNIIAHSMGNRGLLRVAERIARDPAWRERVPFGQIFLAAPDVDIDTFKVLAGAYPELSERTTLYVSPKDLALKVSGLIHDYPRAGFFPPITVLPRIETIKVSDIAMPALGHNYFAEAREVLYDMYQLLRSNLRPQGRAKLNSRSTAEGQLYWEILP